MKGQDKPEDQSAQVDLLSSTADMDPHPEWYDIADAKHFWMKWRFKALQDMLKQQLIPLDRPLKVLDIGCGHGILTDQLESNSSWTIDGADLNLTALKMGQAGRGKKYFYDITEHHPDMVEIYDAVLLFDVLEHIPEPRVFLDSVVRHVAPEGYIILNVPANQELFSNYDSAAGHLRRYDRRSLTDEFTHLPVEILDTRYWGISLIPVLKIRQLLLSRQQDDAEILRKGFKVPNPLMNSLMSGLMQLETGLVKSPGTGSSLLLLARKSS